MSETMPPSRCLAREYLERRTPAPEPLPTREEVRRELGGTLITAERQTQTEVGERNWLAGCARELYQDLLASHGFVCSMSRKGNCWDNAVAERFFLNFKMERVWQRQYANHTEAKADITDYIVGFYNCKRINSALGNLPPSVYEQKMAEREPIVVSEIT